MKISLPSVGTIRLVLEGILVLVVWILFVRGCGNPNHATDRGTADSTFYWKNKYGEAVASQKAQAEQFSVQDARISHLLDSIARVYNTNAKKIQELIVAATTSVTHLPPVPGTHEVDTVKVPGDPCPQILRMRQTFESKWYTARAQIGDSSYLDITRRDTVTGVWKTVTEGKLFHKKTYLQFDLHFADTSQHVTQLTAFRRLDRPKQYSVTAETELLYLDRQIRPLAGLGLERQTGRLTVGFSGGKDLSQFTGTNIRTNPWYGRAHLRFQLLKL
jgi:hypothetical protein